MASDPTPEITLPLMHAMVEAGADVIELGAPFSDPMADGPVIQAAAERSLEHNTSLHDVFELVAEFRKTDDNTPIIVMGYLNPIEVMGYQTFAEKAATPSATPGQLWRGGRSGRAGRPCIVRGASGPGRRGRRSGTVPSPTPVPGRPASGWPRPRPP